MSLTVWMYLIYLAISVVVTVWVARTLFKRGGIFLVDAFGGNVPLAESVNHLLVVGFYLINIGYVTLALQSDTHPESVDKMIEILSGKIGIVLLVLGGMHFFNLAVFTKVRRLGTRRMTPANAPNPMAVAPAAGTAGYVPPNWQGLP